VTMRLGILATIFISGAAVMSLEMASFRQFSSYFGDDISIWGSLISVFLGGLAIGAMAGGLLADRRPALWKLGAILTVGGVLVLAMPFYSETVLDWASGKGNDLPKDWGTDSQDASGLIIYSPPSKHWQALGTGALLFGLPALLLGMASPYAARLYVRELKHVGGGVGLVYGISTLGSIVGTLGTSFYLVAWMGTRWILWSNAIGLVLLGAALAAAHGLRRGKQAAA